MAARFALPLLLAFLPCTLAGQQFPHSSAFLENAHLWNPALTAQEPLLEIAAGYRQQWLGYTDAPRSLWTALQLPLPDYNMGFGGFVLTDRAGPFRFNSLTLHYAYHLRPGLFRFDRLSLGLGGSIAEYHYRNDELHSFHPNDPELPEPGSSVPAFDADAGLFYRSYAGEKQDRSYLFLGLGVTHLLQNPVRFEQGARRFAVERVRQFYGLLGLNLQRSAFALQPLATLDLLYPEVQRLTLGLRLERRDAFHAGLFLSSDRSAAVQAALHLRKHSRSPRSLLLGMNSAFSFAQSGRFDGLNYEFFLAWRIEQ